MKFLRSLKRSRLLLRCKEQNSPARRQLASFQNKIFACNPSLKADFQRLCVALCIFQCMKSCCRHRMHFKCPSPRRTGRLYDSQPRQPFRRNVAEASDTASPFPIDKAAAINTRTAPFRTLRGSTDEQEVLESGMVEIFFSKK